MTRLCSRSVSLIRSVRWEPNHSARNPGSERYRSANASTRTVTGSGQVSSRALAANESISDHGDFGLSAADEFAAAAPTVAVD